MLLATLDFACFELKTFTFLSLVDCCFDCECNQQLINAYLCIQEFLKALIGFIDVAGLYFALTQLTHRNISQNHKFQAVGLGE